MKASTTEVVTTGMSLAIPSNVIPKPTKQELISALLERARIKHETAIKDFEKNIEVLRKKLFALAEKEMKKTQTPYSKSVRDWGSSPCIRLEFNIHTPEIGKLFVEYRKLKHPGNFDAAATKRAIRESLSNSSPGRANPLLENKAAIKALDLYVAYHAIA